MWGLVFKIRQENSSESKRKSIAASTNRSHFQSVVRISKNIRWNIVFEEPTPFSLSSKHQPLVLDWKCNASVCLLLLYIDQKHLTWTEKLIYITRVTRHSTQFSYIISLFPVEHNVSCYMNWSEYVIAIRRIYGRNYDPCPSLLSRSKNAAMLMNEFEEFWKSTLWYSAVNCILFTLRRWKKKKLIFSFYMYHGKSTVWNFR